MRKDPSPNLNLHSVLITMTQQRCDDEPIGQHSYQANTAAVDPLSTSSEIDWTRLISNGANFLLRWSPVRRNCNRPIDKVFASIWRTPVDDESVCSALISHFPDLSKDEISSNPEKMRDLVRMRCPPCAITDEEREALSVSSPFEEAIWELEQRLEIDAYGSPERAMDLFENNLRNSLCSTVALEKISAEDPLSPTELNQRWRRLREALRKSQEGRNAIAQADRERGLRLYGTPEAATRLLKDALEKLDEGKNILEAVMEKRDQRLYARPEETWHHLPEALKHLLAALNAAALEAKIRALSSETYHTKTGAMRLRRLKKSLSKVFNLWRTGAVDGLSRGERLLIRLFFVFLTISTFYPDISAGILAERQYNERSIGPRFYSLFQIYYHCTYEYTTLWVLYLWSLERVTGAIPGNLAYFLAAVVPSVNAVHTTDRFRLATLVVSVFWQIGIQFWYVGRDSADRLRTFYQMRTRQKRQRDPEHQSSHSAAHCAIRRELITLKSYSKQRATLSSASSNEEHAPLRSLVERYLKFTAQFALGRSADSLLSSHREDLEQLLNIYEDYDAVNRNSSIDKGHIEPRVPKILLVVFDIVLFAFVGYCFWPLEFIFNTVVAYGAVTTIKQAVIAGKHYQTLKAAQRLFVNMAAWNIWTIFFVAVPYLIDEHVLEQTVNFVLLTLTMVFATCYLTEPIAPLYQRAMEKAAQGLGFSAGG